MTLRTLFLDFDDSLVETEPLLRHYVRDQYGIHLPDGYICGHSLHQIVNAHLPPEHQKDHATFLQEHKRHFQMSRAWQQQLQPFPDADSVVQRLSRKYELWVVTSRSQNSISVIRNVLDDLFPGAITGIHCVWQYQRNGIWKERPKHTYMEQIPADCRVAFIDDHPPEIRRARRIVSSYLFDPKHRHTNETGIEHRVHSWNEIGALLL